MFCGKCGARNKDGARFCTSCGAPLARAGHGARPVVGGGRRGPGASAFIARNSGRLFATILMASLAVACVVSLAIAFAHMVARLSSLDALAAGVGTAVLMVGMLTPCILALLALEAVVLSMRGTATARGAYGPAAAALVVCILMVVLAVALGSPLAASLSGDMADMLRDVVEACLIPSAVGAVLSVMFVIVLASSGAGQQPTARR